MEYMGQKGTISKEDLSLVLLTDSVGEAMQHIGNLSKELSDEAP